MPTGNKYIKLLLLLAVVLFLIFPRREIGGVRSFSIIQEGDLKNIRITRLKNGKRAYSIRDLTYQQDQRPDITDLVLSFNYPPQRVRRDDTRNYEVKKSFYKFVKGRGSLGKGCAHFYNRNHRVEIQTARNLWLGSCDDLGSFTIEFRFMPYSLKSESILFKRIGYFSGEKRGIEIALKNRRIVARFYGVFKSPDGTRYNVFLNRGQTIKEKKWHHFSISYDRISGKLTKLLNGHEEEVVYATATKEPFNGVYSPLFNSDAKDGSTQCLDLPVAVIGHNFSGLLDEFKISYKHFDDLDSVTEIAYRNYKKHKFLGRLPYNVEGIITSPVYTFNGTGTKVTEFMWDETIRKNTFIWMEFRISDSKFRKNDPILRWYKILKGQRKIFLMKDLKNQYLRGKYYQWRAHLVASPEGKYSPQLYNVTINYKRDLAPTTPLFLSTTKIGHKYLYLKWKKNVDADIYGYKIYYGTSPRKYDGIITHVKGKRITNRMAKENYITIKIDNQLIEENKQQDRKNLLLYPFLEDTVLYFFAVSAYDSYKPDTPYNHESDLSKQVTARPYGGSEIK